MWSEQESRSLQDQYTLHIFSKQSFSKYIQGLLVKSIFLLKNLSTLPRAVALRSCALYQSSPLTQAKQFACSGHEKTAEAVFSCAQDRTRTCTPCGLPTSRVKVYQFLHLGNNESISILKLFSTKSRRERNFVFVYSLTSSASATFSAFSTIFSSTASTSSRVATSGRA